MSAKVILVFCAQALFVQLASSQCAAGYAAPYNWVSPGFAYDGYGVYDGLAAPGLAYRGLACNAPTLDFTPTSGGALPVTSSSAIPPTGLSVISENVYEGALAVAGELPFVGTAAVEGLLPTAGAGAINHACGNGINAMISETTAFAPGYAGAYAPAAAIAPVAAAYAPGPFTGPFGFGGCGCGSELIY